MLFSGFLVPELRPGSPTEPAATVPAANSAEHKNDSVKLVLVFMTLFLMVLRVKQV